MAPGEAGDERIGWRNVTACVALPCLLVVALGYRSLPGVLHGGLVNPDSYMRMVRLRETLTLHRPAYIVTGDGSGHGTLLHWSHLLDSLVVLLAVPFRLFLDPAAALHAAAVLMGPVAIGGLGFVIAWTAAPFAGTQRLAWLGPVLVALSPAVGAYALPGVLHHHVPIIVATVMAGGYAARIIAGVARQSGGLALGAWAAVAIWLTPEVTPLLLLVFGGVWLAWVATPCRTDIAPAMVAAGAAFLLVVAAALAVDPPYAGYTAVEIDRLSILFVGLALAVLGSAASAVLIDRATAAYGWRMPVRIAAAILSGAASFALWAAVFPQALRGPAGMVSAADWHAMFDAISEMQPVGSFGEALGLLFTGTLATVLLGWLAWRQRNLLLAYLTLCAAALVAIGFTHVRFAAYPETLAAIMLPIALNQVERYVAAWQPNRLALARVALIALFFALPPVGSAMSLSRAAHAAEAGGTGGKSCSVSGLAAMLAPYAGQVVLADVNDTPELLYRTQVWTVGSLYHRDMAAFLRLRAAWRSGPSNTVPPALTATQASLVLFCPSDKRSLLIADLPRDTLLDRLNHGAIPPWLHQIAADKASGNILYRVVQ